MGIPPQDLTCSQIGKLKPLGIGVCDVGNKTFRRSSEPEQNLQDAIAFTNGVGSEARYRRYGNRTSCRAEAVHLSGNGGPTHFSFAATLINRFVQCEQIEIRVLHAATRIELLQMLQELFVFQADFIDQVGVDNDLLL